jgi:hypothetical protein
MCPELLFNLVATQGIDFWKLKGQALPLSQLF